ncbi:hypothetical protein L7F22_014448 [Adiantum nelumboides]|nr:hypothetical protein [Adiantum nelumboides]
MGHITVVGNSDAQVRQHLQPILDALDVATETAKSPAHKLPKELTLAGVVDQPTVSEEAAAAAAAAAASKATKSAADFAHPQPLVGIIMGSDSDLGVMLPAAQILKRFNVPFELTIVSAHRTPTGCATMPVRRRAEAYGPSLLVPAAQPICLAW